MPYDKTAILDAIRNSQVICYEGKHDVQRIVEAIIGEPLELPPPPPPAPIYKVGDQFEEHGHINRKYVLAAIGPHRLALIDIKRGVRFRDAVEVRDFQALTPLEWSAVGGDNFALVDPLPF